jgi:ribosomal protein S18 acetylase RimI-like enzyme
MQNAMIEYRNSVDVLSQEQLHGFFVGWPNPPLPGTLLAILRNALHSTIAVDTDTGNVVGFIYAVGDGILSAYIPLLEVLPEYQHRGIGGELVQRLLEQLADYYMVDLCCDRELTAFYDRFGMTAVTGMVKRNYSRQSGR